MASIWKLPTLFICENNQYATEVPFSYSSGSPSVAGRAAGYGLPGFEIDGNDVVEIARIAGDAVARARAGQGATLIECKTYRTRAHAEGMGDFTYRTREEVDAWKKRCPITRLRAAAPAELSARMEAIDAEILEVVREAREFAEKSPYPEAASATTHVYSAAAAATTPESAIIRPAAPATPRELSFTQATVEALAGEMARNPTIFVMGEGIGIRGGNFRTTPGLYDLHGPERLCDTPICERGFVGLAGGAAMTGTRPVIDFMFADFILDSIGEIINQIAKMQYMSSGRLKMPVLLRGCVGIGHSAATHHSGSYHALYGQVPGLRVVMPSNAYDAKGLMLRALRCSDPVMFLEHREILTAKCHVPEHDYEIEFGKASIVREGTDVTVVALAKMVPVTLGLCNTLQQENISVELIDPRTISPLDTATILRSVAKTGRLLIVEETPAAFGLGAEVAAQIADAGFNDLDAPIKRVNGAFAPTPYAPTLEAAVIPTETDIVRAVRDLVRE
jgi:2-oxoisovalerate dehydrogenase E1 component